MFIFHNFSLMVDGQFSITKGGVCVPISKFYR
nr:MAG TPA: hypothetical protein [Caudoviricetes sp.]